MDDTPNTIDTTPASTTEQLEHLAEPDDATDYVEQRKDDQASETDAADGKRPTPGKRQSRYQRIKHARDMALMEAADLRREIETRPAEPDNELRQQIEQTDYVEPDKTDEQFEPVEQFDPQLDPNNPQAPYTAYQQSAEYVRDGGAYEARKEQFRTTVDDFDQVMELGGADIAIPPSLEHLILKSEYGPAIAYAFAGGVDGGIDMALALIDASPIQQAQFIGQMESAIRLGAQRQPQRPPYKAQTSAPPPPRRITGGAGPAPDLHRLADGDMESYVRTRRAQQQRERR